MRVTKAVISIPALLHNLLQVRKRVGSKVEILAMVKANAYGHGLIECTRAFRTFGVRFVGVAYLDEALQLRRSGDRQRIVVLTPPFPEEVAVYDEYRIDCTISSEDLLHYFGEYTNRVKRPIMAHLCVDTGMHREGVAPDQVVAVMRNAQQYPYLQFVGIWTHFVSADLADRQLSYEQLHQFQQVLERLRAEGWNFAYIHAANSAAIADMPESYFTMVRPGIALYGYNPSPTLRNPLSLQPALQLVTAISEIRTVQAGEGVSYGPTYIAKETTRIATLPIGYGDGFFRCLSNRAYCIIRQQSFPLVGTICMDECMVDIGHYQFPIGEEVVLIGDQGEQRITAEHIARWAGTIPYEILAALSHRIPRIYVDETGDSTSQDSVQQIGSLL